MSNFYRIYIIKYSIIRIKLKKDAIKENIYDAICHALSFFQENGDTFNLLFPNRQKFFGGFTLVRAWMFS